MIRAYFFKGERNVKLGAELNRVAQRSSTLTPSKNHWGGDRKSTSACTPQVKMVWSGLWTKEFLNSSPDDSNVQPTLRTPKLYLWQQDEVFQFSPNRKKLNILKQEARQHQICFFRWSPRLYGDQKQGGECQTFNSAGERCGGWDWGVSSGDGEKQKEPRYVGMVESNG